MSEKPKKEHDAGGDDKKKAATAGAAGGGFLTKLPILLGGVMVIEAVVLFAGFKFLGAGAAKAASAEMVHVATPGEGGEGKGEAKGEGAATQPDRAHPVELPVADFRAPNRRNGHSYMFEVSIVASTHSEFEERVKTAIADRGNLIRDRIRTIIAQSDPEKLSGGSEPGLETLRRQVKYQLDEIIGDGLIDEVLVPKCIPFRTDY